MSAREQRAAHRRSSWYGEITERGAPKGALYAGLPVDQRLQAFVALNARAWKLAGLDATPGPRAEWPGEVFELRDG